MSFSENIKKLVREKSAFRCCRCQSIGIQIHHIIPDADNGPDTEDNAAPLCPSCHDYFGANPIKRKEIRSMRDWWYNKVEIIYPNHSKYGIFETINSRIEDLESKKISLPDLKRTLKEVAFKTIDNLNSRTARITASRIASTASLPTQEMMESLKGGDGGDIFLFTDKLSGTGKITTDGGDGNVGGKAGNIHIESKVNKFSGRISAKGGKSKK